MKTVNWGMARAIVIVGAMAMLGKAASFVKDLCVAAAFGRGDELDAFLIALVLPTFVTSVIAIPAATALIPAFIQVRERAGIESAAALFKSAIIWTFSMLGLMTGALAIIGPVLLPVVASGFGPEKLSLTFGLYYFLLPMILLNGLSILLGAVLNAGERFARTSLASILVPVASVGVLVIFGTTWGIYAFAAGTLLGALAELILLSIGMRRQGISLRMNGRAPDNATRRLLWQYLPLVGSAIIMNGNQFCDQIIAGGLANGSVSALNYGNKTVAVVQSVGVVAFSTAVLPFFSRMAAAGDWHGLRRSLKSGTRLILGVTVPLTLLLYFFSDVIIIVLFRRGEFSESDGQLVGQIQAMYVLQIPFYCLGILFVRLISSLHANWIFIIGNTISLILTVAFDLYLVRIMGIAGIALATTLMYVVACFFLVFMGYTALRTAERRESSRLAKLETAGVSLGPRPQVSPVDGGPLSNQTGG